MRSRTAGLRRSLAIGPALAAAIVAAGCGGSSSKSSDEGGAVTSRASTTVAPAQAAAGVQISNFKFQPPIVTVKAGGTVSWTNRDSAPHTATAKDNSTFNTDTLNQGRTKTVKFAKPGTYPYYCQFHAFMTGTVVVR